jgi:hypothetical protein
MNFQQIQTILNDLPATFRRPGNPFLQYIDALVSALTRGGIAADGVAAEGTDFSQAQYGWLDTWGLLFNIARQQNQRDANYSNQIAYTVNVSGGPPVQIIRWLSVVFGITVEISENIPGVGYSLLFPPVVTTPQLVAMILSIAYVRPAGVPFTVLVESGGGAGGGAGTYLTTINFLDAPRAAGAFLAGGSGTLQDLGIGPSTNNAQPLLPDLFLIDPTLNPSFAASGVALIGP